MKTSLFNSILCASLLIFAVGCGKDSKGGGGSSYNNPYVNAGQINQPELDKVKAWYNGKTEGSYPSNFGIGLNAQKTVSTYNTQQTCEDKKFLGIPYQLCTFDGSPSTNKTTFTYDIILNDGRLISSKNNTELNEALNATGKTLMEVKYVDAYRTQISYLLSSGEIVTYGINRGMNSQLNPEFKRVTSQTQRIDTVIEPK